MFEFGSSDSSLDCLKERFPAAVSESITSCAPEYPPCICAEVFLGHPPPGPAGTTLFFSVFVMKSEVQTKHQQKGDRQTRTKATHPDHKHDKTSGHYMLAN
jgi:hypothetical protein